MWVKRRSPQPVIPATGETRITWLTSVILSYRRGEELREGQSQAGRQTDRQSGRKKGYIKENYKN